MQKIGAALGAADNGGVQVSENLDAIIAGAESTARGIIDQAEKEARRFIDDVRQQSDREVERRAVMLADLSDSLIEHAELLRKRSQELLDSLEPETGIESEVRISAPEELSPDPELRSETKPIGEADPVMPPDFGDSSERFSAGARLLATQMAVAGSSVEDVRERLINDFGIADPQPLLDLVFGPG